MDEQRLAEIEREVAFDPDGFWDGDVRELITEVRRLRAELARLKQAAATEALFEEGDDQAIARLRAGFTGRPDTHIPGPDIAK